MADGPTDAALFAFRIRMELAAGLFPSTTQATTDGGYPASCLMSAHAEEF